MKTSINPFIGILSFAFGGFLLLYAVSYIVREAVVTSTPLSIASFGVTTGFLAFLFIGLGLYLIFQRVIEGKNA